MTDEATTDQKVIKAYVPSYQKQKWCEHADELGMSQSEFLKAMVQAGRRGFTLGEDETHKAGSGDETPRVEDLEDMVLDVLDDGYRSRDTLVESLTEGLEDRLETTLQRLQRENRIRYSGRHGGYTVEDANGD